MSYAAGVIPYTVMNNNFHFLLGMETSNRKWSGFVGGAEPNETIEQTAIREFHEETAKLFERFDKFIQKQIASKTPVIEKTATGRTVYLWFIKFPEYTLFMNLSPFHENKKILHQIQFNEKSTLRWFNLNEIKNENVLFKLKKTINVIFK